jgi:hypothetical protein
MHSKDGTGSGERRVGAAVMVTVVIPDARRIRRVLTASTVYLAVLPRGRKPSKMHHPTRLAGTQGGPGGLPEPAEADQVRWSASVPQDPARIGPHQHRRTRPPGQGRPRGLAGPPTRHRPHHRHP